MSWFRKSVDEKTIKECDRIMKGVKAVLVDSYDRIRKLKNNKETSSAQLGRFAKEQLPTTRYLLQNLEEMKQCRGLRRELHWGKEMRNLEELIELYQGVNRARSSAGGAGGAGGVVDLEDEMTFINLIFDLLAAILYS